MPAGKGAPPLSWPLAWLLAQGEDIVPIPGTKQRRYLEENVGELTVELSRSDLEEIEEVAPGMRTING